MITLVEKAEPEFRLQPLQWQIATLGVGVSAGRSMRYVIFWHKHAPVRDLAAMVLVLFLV